MRTSLFLLAIFALIACTPDNGELDCKDPRQSAKGAAETLLPEENLPITLILVDQINGYNTYDIINDEISIGKISIFTEDCSVQFFQTDFMKFIN